MWFVFGLVTLLSFCIYNIYKKLNAGWHGIEGKSKEISYFFKLNEGKDEIKSVLLGIDCPSRFDFSLKRESSLDRFAEKIGLAREH